MFGGASVAVLDNCSFINNAASTHGGGLYWGYSSNSMISNCLFENNISSAGGYFPLHCNIMSQGILKNARSQLKLM